MDAFTVHFSIKLLIIYSSEYLGLVVLFIPQAWEVYMAVGSCHKSQTQYGGEWLLQSTLGRLLGSPTVTSNVQG